MITTEDITNRFAFHAAPDQEKRDAHTSVRIHCANLAHYINSAVPDGREKSSAIAQLELVMFWANAALARQNPIQP